MLAALHTLLSKQHSFSLSTVPFGAGNGDPIVSEKSRLKNFINLSPGPIP